MRNAAKANNNVCHSSMAWFGYDQGVFSGVLISADFKKYFPETSAANISGITSSCFSVSDLEALCNLACVLLTRPTSSAHSSEPSLHSPLATSSAEGRPSRSGSPAMSSGPSSRSSRGTSRR